MPDRELISTAQAAAIIGVSRPTIWRWAGSGELPNVKMDGKTGAYVFDRLEVENFKLRRDAAKAEAGKS